MKFKLLVTVTPSVGSMGSCYYAGTDFNGQHFAQKGKTPRDAINAVKQAVSAYCTRQRAEVFEEDIEI